MSIDPGNIEITLSLKDQITIDIQSFTKTCLNLNIEIVDFDELRNKHIYKIHKIEISENKQDIIEDDEPEKLLDFYEIFCTSILDKITQQKGFSFMLYSRIYHASYTIF